MGRYKHAKAVQKAKINRERFQAHRPGWRSNDAKIESNYKRALARVRKTYFWYECVIYTVLFLYRNLQSAQPTHSAINYWPFYSSSLLTLLCFLVTSELRAFTYKLSFSESKLMILPELNNLFFLNYHVFTHALCLCTFFVSFFPFILLCILYSCSWVENGLEMNREMLRRSSNFQSIQAGRSKHDIPSISREI